MNLPNIPMMLAQTGPGGSPTSFLLFAVLLLGVMYFVMIRPQMKQQKALQTLIAGLKKGDDVITSGGIIGRIFSVDDKVVSLDVGGGVKLRVLKSSVLSKVTIEPPKTEADSKKEEKKDEKKETK